MSLYSLEENWSFFEPNKKKWFPAVVPGCIHTDLLRNKLIPDPFWGSNEHQLQWIETTDWQYQTHFQVPEDIRGEENVDLVADGLDTLATIELNGTRIASTENMFVGYRFPVKKLLKPGRNELKIHFSNPMDYIKERQKSHNVREWNDPIGGCSNIRKMQCCFGWDWGPRFVTSGIYKWIGLHGWSVNRLEGVRIHQHHEPGKVKLGIEPRTSLPTKNFHYAIKVSLDEQVIAESSSMEVEIPEPELWWPNGLGEQPLYEVEVQLRKGEVLIDQLTQRIGLRTIVLDCHKDEYGESFQFVVNGVPVFAKGANWIPAHSFVTEVTPKAYDELIDSAVAANMNLLRVWGGGIYEMDAFYDLCDEQGLLVWQDFMFACALYPGDPRFLKLVEAEAACQVARLSNRACLALWCGNNELEQNPKAILETAQRKKAYDTIFYKILPTAVERYDGTTAYWPSSPHNPEGYEKGHNNENAGDSHFWDVWHAGKPVKTYEQKKFRFCSEFGMQSYSSVEVARTFCPEEEMNVFSPAMENHQKHNAGNAIMFDYISRLFRFPKNYDCLSYLSQLNQAYCLRTGVEHFRRNMPRTMGSIYWQLNDCWPVFSWSSLEFGGNWKALHYQARRFYSPLLVSVFVPGDERLHTGNRLISTIHDVELFTVSDLPEAKRGTLKWSLNLIHPHKVIEKGSKEVTLKYGQSIRQKQLDFAAAIQRHGSRNLTLRVWLEVNRETVSEQTIFFTAPRYISFQKEGLKWHLKELDPAAFEIRLNSTTLHSYVRLTLKGHSGCFFTDNYFDVHPGVEKRVQLYLPKGMSKSAVSSKLEVMSLVDSYC